MDPLELLIRGVAALALMGLVILLARIRFRDAGDDAAPTDIGLD